MTYFCVRKPKHPLTNPGNYPCPDYEEHGCLGCHELERIENQKKTAKCDFCELLMPVQDEYGRYSMYCTRLVPFPALDLDTGEYAEKADPPYYSLFIYEDGVAGEQGSFPIKYCPCCGRKLEGGT